MSDCNDLHHNVNERNLRGVYKMTVKNGDESILQSVDNALKVIELFKDYEELGVTQIADELGIAKSTAFRLLNTLRSRKYVIKNDKTDNYRLGFLFATLGDIVKNRNEIIRISQPYLAELTLDVLEVSYLSILEDDYNIRFINKISENTRISIYSSPVGNTMPAYCTAAGKAILSKLPEPRIEQYIRIVDLNKLTPNTITEKDKLRNELIKINQSNLSIDNEESEPGLTCFATSILNPIGDVIAAISISGPTGRITIDKNNKIKALQKTAENIMRELL